MIVIRWLGTFVAVLLGLLLLTGIAARYSDGPIAIFPGGELVSGELHTGQEPAGTFARDISELELQLLDPPRSRTLWPEVHDKRLFVVSAYMNSPVGGIWKKWPAEMEKDPRARIRIDGKRYERTVKRTHDPVVIAAINSEIGRKYGQAPSPDADQTGDVWYFELVPRES